MAEPETRASLMLRLRDPRDQLAWSQFVAIYEPFILKVMQRRGLQEADARDATQLVILTVMTAMENWQPDGRAASFRRWLFSIARNLSLRFIHSENVMRGPMRRGEGGSEMLERLNSLPEPEARTVHAFDEDYRDSLFQWAAEQIRSEFREPVWQSFWRTCVLHESVADVAHDLGMTPGYIYVARSRIITRLRQIIEEFEAGHDAK